MTEAAAILRFYASEFGPCPYPSLNLALVESRVPGGHSPPGMIVVSVRPALLRGALRDDPASFPDVPDFFIAHELAHQWWGHGVAGQNYHERWISEAFAQYAAALWVRHRRGEAAFRDMLVAHGPLGASLRGQGADPPRPSARPHRGRSPDLPRRRLRQGGVRAAHAPPDRGRARLPPAGMAPADGEPLRQDRHRTTCGRRWRPPPGSTSGPTSRSGSTARPCPSCAWPRARSPGAAGYRTEITVQGRDLPGPVPLEVAISHPAGTEVRTVRLEPEGGSWTVDTPGPPRRVDVNAGRGLLARVDSQLSERRRPRRAPAVSGTGCGGPLPGGSRGSWSRPRAAAWRSRARPRAPARPAPYIGTVLSLRADCMRGDLARPVGHVGLGRVSFSRHAVSASAAHASSSVLRLLGAAGPRRSPASSRRRRPGPGWRACGRLPPAPLGCDYGAARARVAQVVLGDGPCPSSCPSPWPRPRRGCAERPLRAGAATQAREATTPTAKSLGMATSFAPAARRGRRVDHEHRL